MKIVVTKKNLNAFKCNYREIIQQKSHNNDENLTGSISKFSKFISHGSKDNFKVAKSNN